MADLALGPGCPAEDGPHQSSRLVFHLAEKSAAYVQVEDEHGLPGLESINCTLAEDLTANVGNAVQPWRCKRPAEQRRERAPSP